MKSPPNGYTSYVCSSCGTEASNTYSEPHKTRLLERQLCFQCNHWVDFRNNNLSKRRELTIIEGIIYVPGNRLAGNFRGMGGRRFDIEYVGDSTYCGQFCTTFDLWSGGKLPSDLRKVFPDTARFCDAEFVDLGNGHGAWNHTRTKRDPYQLPHLLKRNDQ